MPAMFCDMKSTFLVYFLVTYSNVHHVCEEWQPFEHLFSKPATSGNPDRFARLDSILELMCSTINSNKQSSLFFWGIRLLVSGFPLIVKITTISSDLSRELSSDHNS